MRKTLRLARSRSSTRTFRQKKNGEVSRSANNGVPCVMPPEASGTLGSGDLKQAVRLPVGEDLCEWIAVNTVDFFSQINLLYGTLTDYCTESTCPVMSAGPRYEYYWSDGQSFKKATKFSAPRYVNYLMPWVHNQLENEAIFPSKIGVPFPPDFLKVARVILKRLFRVYAHIYNVHFRDVQLLDEAIHLNTSFKHFVYFVLEFDLVRERELEPLQRVIEELTFPKLDRLTLEQGESFSTPNQPHTSKNTISQKVSNETAISELR